MLTTALIVGGLFAACIGGAVVVAWLESDVPTPPSLRRGGRSGRGHR